MKGNSYNRKFGENPDADEILNMIGATRDEFRRYRDVYVSDGGTWIKVYTRIGGTYAPYYRKTMDALLAKYPGLIGNLDDDATYYYIRIPVPREHQDQAFKLYAKQGAEPLTVTEKFRQLQEEILKMDRQQFESDPRFAEDVALLTRLSGIGSGNRAIADSTDDDLPDEFRPEILRGKR